MKNIKAILFDSGRVLNGPVTGHWFITPNFWEYVDKSIFDSLDKSKIASSFTEADKYIVTQKLMRTKDEEYQHFTKFYEIFSSQLPELKLTADAIENVAKDAVSMSLVDHFLGKVLHKELYFICTQGNGAVYNAPGLLRIMTNTDSKILTQLLN
ncbi:MAG: hypothetical protein UHM85_00135, partial [Acutalibacteraceae bacterium]|nr:hypothetical protein [Acutalibacteraceae bacterium]